MRTRLGGEPEKEVQALASASYGRSETPALEGAGRHKPESDTGLRQAKSGQRRRLPRKGFWESPPQMAL